MSVFEFQHKFDQFQHDSQREPVNMTRHGRQKFLFISAEQYDWFRASAQRGHRTDDATNVVTNAVERAEMDVEHKPLYALLTNDETLVLPDPKPGLVVRYDYLDA